LKLKTLLGKKHEETPKQMVMGDG